MTEIIITNRAVSYILIQLIGQSKQAYSVKYYYYSLQTLNGVQKNEKS